VGNRKAAQKQQYGHDQKPETGNNEECKGIAATSTQSGLLLLGFERRPDDTNWFGGHGIQYKARGAHASPQGMFFAVSSTDRLVKNMQGIAVVANYSLLFYFVRIIIKDGSGRTLRAAGINRDPAVMVPYLSGVKVLSMNIENV